MTIKFSSLVRNSLGLTAKACENMRFQKSGNGVQLVNRNGVIWKLSTPKRALQDAISKRNNTYDQSSRALHEQQKTAMADEVKTSIREFYGDELGQKIIDKAQVGKDSWVGPSDIIKVQRQAHIQEGAFEQLLRIDGQGAITLACPMLQTLDERTRNQFFGDLRDRVIGLRAFQDGSVTSGDVNRLAQAMLDGAWSDRHRDASIQTFGTVCAKWAKDPNFDLLGIAISPNRAKQLLDLVRQNFEPIAHTIKGGVDSFVAAEARKIFVNEQLSTGFAVLSQQGPERENLAKALEAKHERTFSDDEVDQVLAATQLGLQAAHFLPSNLLRDHPAAYIVREARKVNLEDRGIGGGGGSPSASTSGDLRAAEQNVRE